MSDGRQIIDRLARFHANPTINMNGWSFEPTNFTMLKREQLCDPNDGKLTHRLFVARVSKKMLLFGEFHLALASSFFAPGNAIDQKKNESDLI